MNDNNAEKQFHQGSRLRYWIDKSGKTMIEIVKKSGTPRGSLYELYKKPEILRSRITPILEAIGVDVDDFYGIKTVESNEPSLKPENEALQREITLLRQIIADKDEMIQLLKDTRK